MSAPPLVSEPALSSGAEGTALSEGSSEADLRTHIADLEAALATERGRSEEYKANYVRVAENLNAAIAQNEYYRNAIELALQASRHGATVAAYQPYLPEPAILPTGVIGGTYRLIGRVYNGSSTKVVGIAILELVVDGSVATSKRVSVQVEAGTYTPYDVSIPLNIYGRSITVRPRARWEG
ncbi:MAG TPA: hypothetical protein VGS22_16435 [Thermoanaerobaculia bacterium]|nr:hypothetical protein [Thermoanaerobaculia bacterium]